MSADQLQIFNIAIHADNSGQDDVALHARCAGKRWITRLNSLDQQASRNTLRDTHTLRDDWLKSRNIGETRGRADNASDNATELSSRNSTRNTADHTGGNSQRRRRLFFLNHFDFLRNPGWSAQLA